jgi:hypothetical protein
MLGRCYAVGLHFPDIYLCFLDKVIHLEPIVFTARLIKDGGEYGDEYNAVMTIQSYGDGVAYGSACHGKFSMKDFRELERSLKKYGISKLKWARK